MAAKVSKLTDSELRAQLDALPEHLKGEIIDGELYVQPRPRFRHARAGGFLSHHLGGGFDYDEGGPGGWWILPEPGIELPGVPEIAPDLGGWRRERMPEPPDDEPIRIVPDWVCEVLSWSNARYDRTIKLPVYARVGVAWLWLIDPRDQTLEVYQLREGAWSLRRSFGAEARIRAEPFEAAEIPLARMWFPAVNDAP
jgi:Uma2 family endonuclease